MTAECELCGTTEVTESREDGWVCSTCYEQITGGEARNWKKDPDSGDVHSGSETDDSPSSGLFTPDIEENVFPDNLMEWDSLTSWVDFDRKQPFSPWAGEDHSEKDDDGLPQRSNSS